MDKDITECNGAAKEQHTHGNHWLISSVASNS